MKKDVEAVYYDEMSMIQFTGAHYDSNLAGQQENIMYGIALRGFAQWSHKWFALRLNGYFRTSLKEKRTSYTVLNLNVIYSF